MSEVATQVKKSEAEKLAEKVAKMKANLAEKYPHARVDTLTWDAQHNKYKVQIVCIDCGDDQRWVFTSDLFQVKRCESCAKKAKAAKKAAEKAAIEAYKASKAAPAKVEVTDEATDE